MSRAMIFRTQSDRTVNRLLAPVQEVPITYQLSLSFGLLSLALYFLWFIFPEALLIGKAASALLCFFLFLVLRNVYIFSLFSFFLLSYIGMNLIAYTELMFFEDDLSDNFSYLWMTGVALLVFSLSYLIVFSRKRVRYTEYKKLLELFERTRSIRGLKYFTLFIPIFIAISLLYIEVIKAGGMAVHTRAATKEEFGLLAHIGRYFILFSLPSMFVFGARFISQALLARLINISFFLIFLAAIFLALRTRSYLVGPFFAWGMGLAAAILAMDGVNNKDGMRIRIKGKYLAWAAIFAIIIVSVSAYLRFYRGVLEVDQGQVNISSLYENTTSSGDLGYGYNVSAILNTFDEKGKRLYGQSYYRIIFTPIPRSYWPDKPENTQQVVGEIVGGGAEYYSLPPGFQGDAYINFGFLGAIIFIPFGMAFALLDRLRASYHLLFPVVAFIPLFHLARGGFTNPLVLLFVSFLSVYGFHRLMLSGPGVIRQTQKKPGS